MQEFPGWSHRTDFVEAFRSAVRTRRRSAKRVPKHPPVALRTRPEHGAQALAALREGLLRYSKTRGVVSCVPHAFVPAPPATREELLAEIAAQLRAKGPQEMGRLRLPAYDLVTHSAARADDGEPPLPAEVHARIRPGAESGTPGGNAEGGTVSAGILTVPLAPLVQLARRIPRHLWEWRWTFRLSRLRRYRTLWPEDHEGERTCRAAVRSFAGTRGQGPDAWDALVLTALMIDLNGYARQGVLHPGRRRRRPRSVLLLDGGGPGADVVTAFLALYDERHRECPNPATVVVAALPPEPGTEPGPEGLSAAARRLRTDRREAAGTFAVTLPPPVASTMEVRSVWRPLLRMRPATELFLEGAALLAALWLLGTLSFLPFVGPGPLHEDDDRCIDGTRVRQGGGRAGDLQEQHEQALDLIRERSAYAERKGEKERTVTLGLIHSRPPGNEHEVRSGGSIPELRGVAIALKELNERASRDDHGIWVRIRMYEAGVEYRDAEEAARKIAREADRERLIGVTGFTESRTETLEALKILDRARIPVVTTSASANALEIGLGYHGMAPNNAREAEVTASFLQHANTVRTGGRTCAPATDVAVVTDPADVYSNELGKEFLRQKPFTGSGARIGFTPGDRAGGTAGEPGLERVWDIQGLANAVCDRVSRNDRTLVYWTSRSREFKAFLDEYRIGDCANQDLSVMGGNELTNTALSGGYAEYPWLHLFHTAHTLPVGHPDRNSTAQAYNKRYAEEFREDDLWVNDGHAALSRDAVHVFAEAASEAHATGVELDRRNVHQYVANGTFGMEGASGAVDFPERAPRPENKLLTVLHHEGDTSSVVLMCGKSGNNIDAGREWTQGDDTYPCPEDGSGARDGSD
ncbi:hypothetical protein [Streptomyces sp. HNM0574]|uniref:hypothetical protein n=1 Tax=Streptomyces sp. HNM0574 TaxID=2714954 RepID=UPI001469BE9A|nr:hypothetical protein [Streptomyces sp. HNM0574]NLU70530.1 ABC transporter substrate-binding protein [Streptomyces sp. HNM0574]